MKLDPGQVCVRSWRSRDCSERGLEEKRVNAWQLRPGHIVRAVLQQGQHLKTDGERGTTRERGGRCVSGVWAAQHCRAWCGDEQLRKEALRNLQRSSSDSSDRRDMASCCRLVGTREEAVKAGRMWVANLGSICSWGLHWKLSLGIIRESDLTKSDRWTLRRARLEGDGGDKDAPHTWWVCFNPAEKISNSLEIRNSGT